jgi:hypothetical protein
MKATIIDTPPAKLPKRAAGLYTGWDSAQTLYLLSYAPRTEDKAAVAILTNLKTLESFNPTDMSLDRLLPLNIGASVRLEQHHEA